ncbi:MAG: fumarylacetoacetate hydrolase family protein [Burkholderiales bacterium]|nr:fumarylacetoacetate hydrolase family protein [Burkholderiales bacterium]
MKLLTFRPPRARTDHFGVLLSNGKVLDVSGLQAGRAMPGTMLACIRGGAAALTQISQALSATEQSIAAGKMPEHMFSLGDVTLKAPLIPGKIMAVGKNYSDHAAEVGGVAYTRPSGFIKHTDTIIADGETIRKPGWTEKLDYENELAVVIADDCSEVPPENAYDHVFGYTIMVDLSARDVQFAERKEGNIMIGKNFPTAAPLGPWIVTRDEIPDPHQLKIITRVNGEVRQDASTATQIHKIPQQIAWYSHAGLQAGDIISTGSPAGTGAGYQGEGTWYLQHGDRLECEIERIGTLRNTVSSRKRRS